MAGFVHLRALMELNSPRSLCSDMMALWSVPSMRTGVSWSLLYWAKAWLAPSFSRVSFLRSSRTSLNTSLNSPGGACRMKSDTMRTFSASVIGVCSIIPLVIHEIGAGRLFGLVWFPLRFLGFYLSTGSSCGVVGSCGVAGTLP